MKSEQIKREIEELEARRYQLSREIDMKRSECLNALTSESPYQKGEKVRLFKKITYPIVTEKYVGEGIFERFEYSYKDAVPAFFKVKKDGSKSLNKWGKYDFDRIEKIEK